MNEYGPEINDRIHMNRCQWSLRLQPKKIRLRVVVGIKGSRGRAREQGQGKVLITDKAGHQEVKSQNPMLDFRWTHGLEATVALEVTESSRDKCPEQPYVLNYYIA